MKRVAQVRPAGTGDSAAAWGQAVRHTGDPSGPAPGPGRSAAASLESELARLRARCRAHENALERLTGAILRLRQAHRSLKQENALLRHELASLRSLPGLTHEPTAKPEQAGDRLRRAR